MSILDEYVLCHWSKDTDSVLAIPRDRRTATSGQSDIPSPADRLIRKGKPDD